MTKLLSAQGIPETDQFFLTTLYLGSDKQPMSFLLDTASSWAWVAAPDCKTCSQLSNRFQPASKTLKKTSKKHKVRYDRGWVAGYLSHDNVYLNEKNVGEDISFLYVQLAKGFKNWQADGILGLAPRRKKRNDPRVFIDQMYRKKAIKRNQFSLYLSSDDDFEQSRVWFGGYDHDFIRKFDGFTDAKNEDIDKAIIWAPVSRKSS